MAKPAIRAIRTGFDIAWSPAASHPEVYNVFSWGTIR
jgi:hypothetical protein